MGKIAKLCDIRSTEIMANSAGAALLRFGTAGEMPYDRNPQVHFEMLGEMPGQELSVAASATR